MQNMRGEGGKRLVHLTLPPLLLEAYDDMKSRYNMQASKYLLYNPTVHRTPTESIYTQVLLASAPDLSPASQYLHLSYIFVVYVTRHAGDIEGSNVGVYVSCLPLDDDDGRGGVDVVGNGRLGRTDRRN